IPFNATCTTICCPLAAIFHYALLLPRQSLTLRPFGAFQLENDLIWLIKKKSTFALPIYIDKNGCEVIAILLGGYRYTIHCIQNANPNANTASISPPTNITAFSGSILAWPRSNHPLPTTNGHPSPPALTEGIATSANNSAPDSISISAMTSSDSLSKLCQLFNMFDLLFFCYCRNFYDYVQIHPNDARDYRSLSGL
ncbi:hypothetical protein O181_101036, partial [Austropuccinia psidii MF-1]|nr:hypothetical protein [Austropuccinia psidii MF-1]